MVEKRRLLDVLIGISMLIVSITAYPYGAPIDTCSHMNPSHDFPAQSDAAPYEIDITPKSYTPGVPITVTLRSTGSQKIKGFLLEARRADHTLNQDEILGTFTPLDTTVAQLLACSGNADSGMTHNTLNPGITSVSATWTTTTAVGHVKFRATVVEQKVVYWLGVESGLLNDTSAPDIPPTSTGTTAEISLKECGSTKGCFRIPQGCTPEAKCDSVVAWTDKGTQLDFEISTNKGDWVGVGFSTDIKMGDDSVMHCVHNTGNSLVSVTNAWNKGTSPQTVSPSDAGLSNRQGSFQNGRVRCTWTREKNVTTAHVYDLNNAYYLMLGRGPASGSQISQHSQNPDVSAGTIDLAKHTDVGASSGDPLIKAHGSLMIIAWVICASTAIILARFYKDMWPDSTLCAQKVWFAIHRACMVTVLLCTVAGFIVVFISAGDFSDVTGLSPSILNAHPILGILVTALAITNPIMAIFRCHPGEPKRLIFNWAHWGVGTVAHILGIFAIFTGLEKEGGKAVAPSWLIWVMVVFVAFHVLVDITLEINKCMIERSNKANSQEMEMQARNEGKAASDNGPKRSLFRMVVLAVYILVVWGCGIVMVIMIAS